MTDSPTSNIRMPLTSLDITQDRIDRLGEVFPEVFAEGKIDFDKLRQALGEDIDAGREWYGLTWAGKADAICCIQTPSVGRHNWTNDSKHRTKVIGELGATAAGSN